MNDNKMYHYSICFKNIDNISTQTMNVYHNKVDKDEYNENVSEQFDNNEDIEKNNNRLEQYQQSVKSLELYFRKSIQESIISLRNKILDFEGRLDADIEQSIYTKQSKMTPFLEEMFNPLSGDLHRVLTEFLLLFSV